MGTAIDGVNGILGGLFARKPQGTPGAAPQAPVPQARRLLDALDMGGQAFGDVRKAKADAARVEAAGATLKADGVQVEKIKAQMTAVRNELTGLSWWDLPTGYLPRRAYLYVQLRNLNSELASTLQKTARDAKVMQAAARDLQGDVTRLDASRHAFLGNAGLGNLGSFLDHAKAAADAAVVAADKVAVATQRGLEVTDAIAGFGIFGAGDALARAEAAKLDARAAQGAAERAGEVVKQDLARMRERFAFLKLD